MSSYKLCKYGCNTQITWDTQDSLSRESDGRAHDRDRCQKINNNQAGVNNNNNRQQQKQQPQSSSTTTTTVSLHDKVTEVLTKLQGLETKIDHLTQLVFAQQTQGQQYQQQYPSEDNSNNPTTLLDNR